MKTVLQIVCVVAVVAGVGSIAAADVFDMGPGLTSLEIVPVGNVGNATDTRNMNDGTSGYGSVDYGYSIGKYEVTAGQYTEFLNAVARTDTYGLYNKDMWLSGYGCKIERYTVSGTGPDRLRYRVHAERVNRPVNFVSWGDVARFANWLHNGQPTGAQDLTTTEDGSYHLNGATSDADLLAVTRKPGATWAIPTEDEWYKAAYYNPATSSYFDYPTSSNSAPSDDLTTPDDGNNATFRSGGWTLGGPFYRTEVGEHENSGSPYGTFDQGGNVSEWNEAILDWTQPGLDRGLRGGSFYSFDVLHAFYRLGNDPAYEDKSFGFRVSDVTDPPAAADPPIADADGPYTIWVGDPLILNANRTTKGYYSIVSYMWDLDDDGVFETDAGDQPFFELDYGDVQDLGLTVGGMYDIHLRVTDSTGLTDTDSSSLRVTPEPATLSLMVMGGLAVLRRRRR